MSCISIFSKPIHGSLFHIAPNIKKSKKKLFKRNGFLSLHTKLVLFNDGLRTK